MAKKVTCKSCGSHNIVRSMNGNAGVDFIIKDGKCIDLKITFFDSQSNEGSKCSDCGSTDIDWCFGEGQDYIPLDPTEEVKKMLGWS